MHEAIQASLAKLPGQIQGYAPTLIARLLGVLQEQLARDADKPKVSYAALMIKLGAKDLSEGFAAHVGDVLSGNKPAQEQPAFATSTISGMSLEALDGPDPTTLALQASSDRFKALGARAKALGLRDFRPYGKDLFLGALNAGFERARVDSDNRALLMPYACAALDAELLTLYARFEGMLEKIERVMGA